VKCSISFSETGLLVYQSLLEGKQLGCDGPHAYRGKFNILGRRRYCGSLCLIAQQASRKSGVVQTIASMVIADECGQWQRIRNREKFGNAWRSQGRMRFTRIEHSSFKARIGLLTVM